MLDAALQPLTKRMAVYRFYFISKRHGIVGVPEKHECSDDAAALIRAGQVSARAGRRATAVEVWESRRLVGRVPFFAVEPRDEGSCQGSFRRLEK